MRIAWLPRRLLPLVLASGWLAACSAVLGIDELPPVGEFVSTVDASSGLTCADERVKFKVNPGDVCSSMTIMECKGLPIALVSCVASPGTLTVTCACDRAEASAGDDVRVTPPSTEAGADGGVDGDDAGSTPDGGPPCTVKAGAAGCVDGGKKEGGDVDSTTTKPS